ncbi:MAG: hypothetical protein Q9217_006867, partial [Psora testacea]
STISNIEPRDREKSDQVMHLFDPSVRTGMIEVEPASKRARLSSPPPSTHPPHTRCDLGDEAQLAAQSSTPPQSFHNPPPQATLPSTPSTFPPTSTSTLPLSSANLNRLQAVSSSGVGSEPRSQSETEAASEVSSKELEEELQAGSIDSETAMDNLTPLQVRPILARNFLFIEDDEARKIGNALIKKAMRILDQNRGSDYGETKALQVKEAIKAYANENEATFVINLHKHLFNDMRKVCIDGNLTDEELEDERKWLQRAWDKDDLRARFQINFTSNCIPKIEAGSDFMNKALQQVTRVAIPRPDIAWGIYKTAFTHLQQTFLENLGCALANPELYNIFFILEAKCMNGSIQDAENQCCRSGAAMVQSKRRFNGYVASTVPQPTAPVIYPNADVDSFAFSLAVAPDRANMFVHWCLEDAGNAIKWHMHYLKTYSFNRADELTALHHDIDNILDWGVGPRKHKVVEALEQLEVRHVVVPKPPSPQKRKAGQMST